MKSLSGNKIAFLLLLLTSFAYGQRTYWDRFDNVAYNNNNGTDNFSSNWIEVRDDNLPNSGSIQVVSGRLRFQDLDDRFIYRRATLAGSSSATLSFDWDALNRGDEILAVYIWNPVANTFRLVKTIDATNTGSESYPLTAGEIESNPRVLFYRDDPDWDAADTIYVDNVRFTASIDTDNDGVSDESDLDDDNDGILDSIECSPTVLWVTQGTPETEEQNTIDKLTNLGYTVTVVDENVSGNANNFDVTFIYEDVTSGTVLANVANLTTTTNGIITSEQALHDDILGGVAGGTAAATSVNIVDNTHPITAGLNLGNLNIGQGDYFAGNLVSGTRLANHPNGNIAIAVWETGQAMESSTAPGRRAIVPFSNDNAPFNAAGEDLLVRAIVWTAANPNSCVDTDNDGTIDRLDNDSDGDGCPDALEGAAPNSQIGYGNLDGNNRITGGVDARGIPTVANGGQAPGTAFDNSRQAAECNPCNAGNPDFVDTDGDSIGNTCDLDDDNDGILDCEENGTGESTISEVFSINGDAVQISDFEVQLTQATGNQAGSATITDRVNFADSFNFTFEAFLGADDGGADGIAIIFHDDPDGATAVGSTGIGLGASGIQNGIVLELDTYFNGNGVGDITADHGMIWDSDNQGGAGLLSTAVALGQLEDNDWHNVTINWNSDTNTLRYFVNGTWAGTYTGDIINNYFAGNNLVYFGFTASTGGAVNDQRIRFNNLCDIPLFTDDDGDGVPNYLDLDSDNDGIYDAVEAGHNRPNTNGRVNGAVGTDGIPDAVQAAGQQNNGDVNYTIRNTDGDALNDFNDTDSDNDGCTDPDEASNDANIDSDNNGRYGTGAAAVDANGKVVAASYAEPADTDTNGTQNYRDAETPIAIVTQPDDQNLKVEEDANFSVSATGSGLQYQWFVSTDGGNSFNAISGAIGASLFINNVTLSQDGNLYRVEVTTTNNVCDTVLSDTALLSVEVDDPPVVEAEGDEDYCPQSSMPIAQSISITDPDNTTTDAVYIQISTGYIEGEDLLTLTGSHPGITATWNPMQGELSLTGPATFAEFEAAVLAVEYSSSAVAPTGEREFSITVGEANYLPATGHYYRYIDNLGITWTDANVAADASIYFGLQGYLATLTSQEEGEFSGTQAAGTGWIGGSDAATEGVWLWVTGPEAGLNFWNGAVNGSSPNFAFWNANEPNQQGDEDYAHITHPNVNPNGSWNDLSNTGATSGNYQPQGYVVEYGGMPGDPTLAISDVTKITMLSDPSISVQPTDGTVCLGDNASFNVTAADADTYQWQLFDGTVWNNINDSGIYSGSATANLSFTPPSIALNGNRYRVIVSGCKDVISDTAVLTVTRVLADAGANQTICAGDAVTLTATGANGTPGYTYQWSTGQNTASITFTPTGNPNANTSIDYSVTVTDQNGCNDTDTVRVFIRSRPTASATTTSASCGLDNGTIKINFYDHPDRTGIKFSLDNRATYESTVQDNTGSVTYGGLAAGTYRLWSKWGDNSCEIDIGSYTILDTPQVSMDTQPLDQTVFVNASATFSVATSNADTFQWQISIDAGASFTDLTDGTEYAGTQTATLTVSNVEINKNGYLYRALASNSGTSCTSMISDQALLTVRVRTVITNRRITHRVKKD